MVTERSFEDEQEAIHREREKGEHAFSARRRAMERIGLPQVRNDGLSLLAQEGERFYERPEPGPRSYLSFRPSLSSQSKARGDQ